MKKFVKLAAVFAALVLALSCFVACSNGDDDSDSASVQALQGLWIYEDDNDNDDWGFYIAGNTIYEVLFNTKDRKYYYDKEGDKFSVSGNKIRMYDEDSYFEINGNTLTLKYYEKKYESWETDAYKKIAKTPIGISSDEFKKLDDELHSNSEE